MLSMAHSPPAIRPRAFVTSSETCPSGLPRPAARSLGTERWLRPSTGSASASLTHSKKRSMRIAKTQWSRRCSKALLAFDVRLRGETMDLRPRQVICSVLAFSVLGASSVDGLNAESQTRTASRPSTTAVGGESTMAPFAPERDSSEREGTVAAVATERDPTTEAESSDGEEALVPFEEPVGVESLALPAPVACSPEAPTDEF